MGDLLIGLLGCIPRFQTAVLETGGIVNLVFQRQIKVLVLLWNDVFCVTMCMFSAVLLRGFGVFGFGLYPAGFFIFSGCCVRVQCLEI